KKKRIKVRACVRQPPRRAKPKRLSIKRTKTAAAKSSPLGAAPPPRAHRLQATFPVRHSRRHRQPTENPAAADASPRSLGSKRGRGKRRREEPEDAAELPRCPTIPELP
ncbi:unnamed protein product, partial [Ixodes pacificus]